MTKEEVVDSLKALGYDAFITESIVMINVDYILSPKEQKKFEKDIRDLGYQASYGWKVKNDEE